MCDDYFKTLIDAFRNVDCYHFEHQESRYSISMLDSGKCNPIGILQGYIEKKYIRCGTYFEINIGCFIIYPNNKHDMVTNNNLMVKYLLGRDMEENEMSATFEFERNPTMGIKDALINYPGINFIFAKKEEGFEEKIYVVEGLVKIHQYTNYEYTIEEYVKGLLKKSANK